MHPHLGAGAPGFALSSQYGELVTLTGLRGRRVVLTFFPLAFSATCTSELSELNDSAAMFEESDVQLVGITVDSKASLRAWAEQEGCRFPLLADFWPHGEVARRYGVLLEDRGYAERATFAIDRDGVVRDRFAAGLGESRPVARYEAAIEALR